MTGFEQFLIGKGYIKHILNCKTMKFERTDTDFVSSLGNIDYRYIHKSDNEFLSLIDKGVSVMSAEFPADVRKREIVFGLNEFQKPATLIFPRPKIRLKRNDQIETEFGDDAMNVVFEKVDYETIYDAMFNPEKIIEITSE